MSLGLNDDPPIGALAPEPRHKSAGLAFGLSVLIPGVGQLYCGKTARGGMTLAFWLVGLVLTFSPVPAAVSGQAVFVMLVLWIFSFLDAYFTAIEIDQGQDDLLEGQNPRVAVTLNLLTAGFGYFYLGERTKGITIFVVMQVARLAFPSTGIAGGFISASLLVVQLLAAADAYRIARAQVKLTLDPEPVQPASTMAQASRLPVQVPIALAGLIVLGSVVLVVIGLAVRAGRSGRRPTVVRLNNRSGPARPLSAFRQDGERNATPIPAVDLATAVQDVQRVERKSARSKADVPYLKQDGRVLSAVVAKRKSDPADAIVAHFYRALGLTLINLTHDHDGEPMDASGARAALADFDKVIAGGSDTARTYVPAVSISNAQYWAGLVARNQLHEEQTAYAYWEKCAGQGHAGCMLNVAAARITGEGGEKVDVHEALDLHTIVFNSGVKYHCAGAMSAMNIAYINYFTGVQRPGDDVLQWTKKADGLLDKLEAMENDRNVCHRSDAEVDEFLFQLSRGEKDDTILQDAVSRLDDDSVATKAVIQFISGAIDDKGFEAAVNSSKSEGWRCSAYFDAMWYAELRKEDATARRYYQHLVDIGKFDCGEHLVFASKFKL